MKSFIYSFLVGVASCTSYWDNNVCNEVNIEYPAGAS
jgi:hypothetical protein